MRVHALYRDFLAFLEALPGSRHDPWELYCRCYLDPHRSALTAWWQQCLGLPEEAWVERVRRLRPEDYGLLRVVVEGADIEAVCRHALERCAGVLPLTPRPEVYLLVGFFSPDGFTFQVEGQWAIGLGLERMTGLRLLPLLVAHEYAHCYRRELGGCRTLGGRMVDEGFAVELSRRAFPERPLWDHLLMRPGQLTALQQYERQLWQSILPQLQTEDEALIGRVLYGRASREAWPSRAGTYLGWRRVSGFLASEPGCFRAPAGEVLKATGQPAGGRAGCGC